MAKPFHYGGQAVIEGVMMRGRQGVAISVRQPDGRLNTMRQPLASIYKGRLKDMLFVRGIIMLGETMILGTQALLHSAQIAAMEEGDEKIPTALLWGTVAISVAFAVTLFFLVPLFAVRYLIDPYIGSPLLSVVLEGLIRIALFMTYLRLVAFIPDIRRVFAYHGAEHKTINAYEAGIPLEVGAVKNHSTAHARCGTSFIVVVLITAILVFGLIDVLLGRPTLLLRLLLRLALIPAIAAISYEIIKLGAAHAKNTMVRVLLAPGMMLQRLTTREPDDTQLEAAISALKEVIGIDTAADTADEAQQKGEKAAASV